MPGVMVTVAPPARVAVLPGARRGGLPAAGQGTARWVIGAGVLALVLAAGVTAAVETVPPSPPTVSCSAGPAAGLTDEQRRNAAAIVAVGQAAGVPQRGQIVALATAMQESRLRNINYGDRDSLGLFQQRPSQGWGSPAQVTDPVYAARKFYGVLLSIPRWEAMPVTKAAQAVQRSGFPDAYAKWEGLAVQLVRGTTCATTK